MPVIILCSFIQGSRRWAASEASPVSWGGAQGVSVLVICVQAARTMCSSLPRERGPCCAGPLVESRDFFIFFKKAEEIYSSPSCFLCPRHI